MDKRGDLNISTTTIIIVSGIAGFIILLYGLLQLGFGEQSNEQLCKLSVLGRTGAPVGKNVLPLQCTTEKICLTAEKKNRCSSSFAGEENVLVIELSKDPVKAAKTIEKTSADSMYDCWIMLGQGKLDLAAAETSGDPKTRCIICKRVAIDQSVPEIVLEKVNIYQYMYKNSPDESKLTYLQSFSDEQFNSGYVSRRLPEVIDKNIKERNRDSSIAEQIEKDDSLSKEQKEELKKEIKFTPKGTEFASVFMQIKTRNSTDILKSYVAKSAFIVAGSFFTAPESTYGVFKFAAKNKLLLYAAAAFVGNGIKKVIDGKTSRVYAAGYCGGFTGNKEEDERAKEGCSLIQLIPYDFSAMNYLCDIIEGNP